MTGLHWVYGVVHYKKNWNYIQSKSVYKTGLHTDFYPYVSNLHTQIMLQANCSSLDSNPSLSSDQGKH